MSYQKRPNSPITNKQPAEIQYGDRHLHCLESQRCVFFILKMSIQKSSKQNAMPKTKQSNTRNDRLHLFTIQSAPLSLLPNGLIAPKEI